MNGQSCKKILTTFYKPIVKWYLQKPRLYTYRGLEIIVRPGVFHPGFFYSTKLLLKHLEGLDLFQKRILELGCGSGLISCVLAKKGGIVTATDISKTALANTIENAQRNHVVIEAKYSDLFSNIGNQEFDFIVINPPYYKGNQTTDESFAWYAGMLLEYFQQLFVQLKVNLKHSQCIMILNDACDLNFIAAQAKRNGLNLNLLKVHKLTTEENYIYSIQYA
ncbi:MAG: methyltransferase [Bacteroidetes bacterium]|nr:methyltransferase [Bacteroidota bacterium]